MSTLYRPEEATRPSRSKRVESREMRRGGGGADLGDPLRVAGQGVEAGAGRQSPHLHHEVRRAADQHVQLVVVVHAED